MNKRYIDSLDIDSIKAFIRSADYDRLSPRMKSYAMKRMIALPMIMKVAAMVAARDAVKS